MLIKSNKHWCIGAPNSAANPLPALFYVPNRSGFSTRSIVFMLLKLRRFLPSIGDFCASRTVISLLSGKGSQSQQDRAQQPDEPGRKREERTKWQSRAAAERDPGESQRD